MKRDLSLDFVKGFGIVLVIYGHIHAGDNISNNWVYSYHMPLFFFVSGILFNKKKSNESLVYYVIQEAKKILYPYLTFSFLYLIVKCLMLEYDLNEIIRFFVDTFTFVGRGVFWFLSSLFFAEILYFIIEKKKCKSLIMGAILLLTLFTSSFLQNNDAYQYATIYYWLNIPNRILISTVFLWLGNCIATSKLWSEEYLRKNSLITFLSLFIFLVNAALADKNGHCDLHYSQLNNTVLFYYFAITSSVSLLLLSKRFIRKKGNCLCYFGRYSLVIMLTHTTFNLTEISVDISERLFGNISSLIIDGVAVIIVLCMEMIIIFVINNFFPFLIKPGFTPDMCLKYEGNKKNEK